MSTQNLRERQHKFDDVPLAYSFEIMGAKAGVTTGLEIIKMIAPVFGAILDDENKLSEIEDSSLFSQIAAHLVFSIDNARVVGMIDLLLLKLHKGSQPCSWDEEFPGNYDKLLHLVEFSLKENFGDFFVKYFKAKGFEIPTWEALRSKVYTPLKLEEELSETQQSPQ